MDDDAFYDPADITLRAAAHNAEQTRRELAERQERDAADPEILNAECDAFLAQRKAQEQEQEQLRRAAIAGIENDLAARQSETPPQPPPQERQPPPPQPQSAQHSPDEYSPEVEFNDPRPAPIGLLYALANEAGGAVGKVEKQIRISEQRTDARFRDLEKKLLQRIRELEKQPSAAAAQLLDRLSALEGRLQTVEAKAQFGGRHAKRIVTHRDKGGNLTADVFEPDEEPDEDTMNGYGHA